MARRVQLNGPWSLQGYWQQGFDFEHGNGVPDGPAISAHVPGSVADDATRHGCAPGFLAGDRRGLEWIAARIWVYETLFAVPQEPEEGRSEKAYLLFPQAQGLVAIWVNGRRVSFCSGEGIDVTALLDDQGENALKLVFFCEEPSHAAQGNEAAFPRLGLCGGAALCMVSFARVASMHCEWTADEQPKISISTRVCADNRGKYRFKLRVLDGQGTLVAAHSPDVSLIAAEQTVCHEIALPVGFTDRPSVFSVRLSIERGGIRCDSEQAQIAWQTGGTGAMGLVWPTAPYAQTDEREQYEAMASVAQAIGLRALCAQGDMPPGFALACASQGLSCGQAHKVYERPYAAQDFTERCMDARAVYRKAALARFEGRQVQVELNSPLPGGQGTVLGWGMRPTPAAALLTEALAPCALLALPDKECYEPETQASVRLMVCYDAPDSCTVVLEADAVDLLGKTVASRRTVHALTGTAAELDSFSVEMPLGTGALVLVLRLWEGDRLSAEHTLALPYGKEGARAALASLPRPSLRLERTEQGLSICNDSACCAVDVVVSTKALPGVLVLPGCFSLLPWERKALTIAGSQTVPAGIDSFQTECMGDAHVVSRA